MSATLPLFGERSMASLALPPSDALRIEVQGEMRGKKRAGRRFLPDGSVRTFVDGKTERAEHWLRMCAVTQLRLSAPLEGALALDVEVTVPIPPSWSKRKQADALAGRVWPTGRPDWDNYGKLVSDALNKVVWRDDAQLVDVHFRKVYGVAPGAVLEVRQL